MEIRTGNVIASDNGGFIVEVEVTGCARCAAGNGCGAGLLTAGSGFRQIRVAARDHADFQIGDTVQLSLSPGRLLRMAAIVYGLPLLTAVAAAAAALLLHLGDAKAAIVTLTGLLLGWWGARAVAGYWRCPGFWTDEIRAKAANR